MGAMVRGTEMGGQLWRLELADGSSVWIRHDQARSLSELAALSKAQQRRALVRAAEQFIGDPYLWGGRSPGTDANDAQVTGVDCSGLVNLSYRAIGVAIPRDAHEQFLRATPVATPQLADLIFLSERGNPKKIVHVMLYAGDGQAIEGPGTGLAVRRIAIAKRLGHSINEIAPGTPVEEQTVSFGTYLP